MAIINKQGKIFGKINVIDFSVIMVLLFFVFTVYVGYKVFVKDKANNKKPSEFVVKIRFKNLEPELAKVISLGDVEKNKYGVTIGQVVKIENIMPASMIIHDSKEFVVTNHPYQKDVMVSLRLFCIDKNDVYYYKDFPVKIGSTLTFSTDLYNADGLIVGREPVK